MGIILSIALWVFMCCSALIPNFSPVHFELAYASRILSVYVLISALTLVYEHTKITKDRWVEVLTKSLKEERDTITAMKDNLRVGLFFMDEEDVQFEDILQITFALENLMKTEDSFKEIIEKISNFGSEHEKVGESFVLIELLKKASEKTALSENKMVRFEASDIDLFLQ